MINVFERNAGGMTIVSYCHPRKKRCQTGLEEGLRLFTMNVSRKKVHNLREAVELVESCKDEYITFEFGVTSRSLPMFSATGMFPLRILERYHITADRFFDKNAGYPGSIRLGRLCQEISKKLFRASLCGQILRIKAGGK